MGEPLLGTSSLVHYHQMDGKLQAYDLFYMVHLGLGFSSLTTITLDIILPWAI